MSYPHYCQAIVTIIVLWCFEEIFQIEVISIILKKPFIFLLRKRGDLTYFFLKDWSRQIFCKKSEQVPNRIIAPRYRHRLSWIETAAILIRLTITVQTYHANIPTLPINAIIFNRKHVFNLFFKKIKIQVSFRQFVYDFIKIPLFCNKIQ